MANYVKTILKVMLTIIVIFVIPFIPAMISKILVSLKIFESIEELEKTLNIFNNGYFLAYIGIGAGLLLWYFHKWEPLKEFLKRIKLNFKNGDNQLEACYSENEFVEESNKKKKFIEDIASSSMDSNVGKNNMKSILDDKTYNNNDVLKNENNNLRFFAAYNIINADVKSLLHIIYNEKYIETNKFKGRIIQGFKKRNRRNNKMSKKNMNKYAKNKYETIYKGLIFLNIIEPNEDDTEIRLTKEGKEFVRKYIEKEVGIC